MTKIISWNINGLDKIYGQDFSDFVKKENPDFICLQETHATEDEVIGHVQSFEGYHCEITPGVMAGKNLTCGLLTLSREKPRSVEKKFKCQSNEYPGRILVSDFPGFVLLNCYFPTGTGKPEEKRALNQALKRAFYRDCYLALEEILASGKEVVLCGDFNTARDERDYWGAFQKKKTPGFLPEDHEDIEKLFSLHLTDAFRHKNQEGGHYTWWSNLYDIRNKNLGWRIDYFLVSPGLRDRIHICEHLKDLAKNDHCPIILDLNDNNSESTINPSTDKKIRPGQHRFCAEIE